MNRTVRAKPANEGQITTFFIRRLPRLVQLLGPACLLACTLSAQVASPTGQSNSKQPPAAASQSAPSALAPRLNTSKPGPPQSTTEIEPPPVPVQTETGQLDGASYRIDIPQNWNHSLVIYFHGYEAKPKTFEQQHPPGRILQQILNRGFAVAQSGYSTGGWAVARALHETDAVRSRFVHEHGNPRETYVMGHSMGGLMTVMALEQHPDAYAGGLSLCGVLAPADLVMQRAFANRVAFDAFFPGILPDVDHIPDSFMMNDIATTTTIQKALDAHPTEAAIVRDLADIHTNRGLADVLVFNTFVIQDLRRKAGGNPFDNRNLIYTGTTDDNALNQKVKRYAADQQATHFVSSNYTPTGYLKRKLLAIHTTYDPLVPAATAAYYDEVTRRGGFGSLFVQQYVNRDGHCNITADQTGEAFDELVTWARSNTRPTPGLLPGTPTRTQPAAVTQPNGEKPPPPKNVGKPE